MRVGYKIGFALATQLTSNAIFFATMRDEPISPLKYTSLAIGQSLIFLTLCTFFCCCNVRQQAILRSDPSTDETDIHIEIASAQSRSLLSIVRPF